ncbi:MAG: hypothetical protein ABI622_01915 [Chloroflexota bacterium]
MMRAARLVAIAVIAAFVLAIVWGWALGGGWRLLDMDVYWSAGEQWRTAGNPYLPTPTTTEHSVYRYAPWFAGLWALLTFFPRGLVAIMWSLVLVMASLVAVVPLLREHGRRALPLAALMGGLLFGMSASGNVQPLMIASLSWFLERRSGPLWIGVAGSLKVVPLLFLIPYIARRQWWSVAAGLGVAALLWAPALAFELPSTMVSADYGGLSASLFAIQPALWALAAVAATGLLGVLARSGSAYTWLATGTAALLALPRLFLYDVTLLLPGARAFRR